MKIFSISETAKLSGVSMQAICQRVKKNQLDTILINKKRYISKESLIDYENNRKWKRILDGKPIYDKENLSVKDLASKWKISLDQIYYLIYKNKIPFKRVRKSYVFSLEDIKKIRLHFQKKTKITRVRIINNGVLETKSA